MQPAFQLEKCVAIAFDADVMTEPQKYYFEEDYWRSKNVVTGTAKGRGNSWFINAPFGQVVLRRYLRGGWAARISRDRYFYTGVESSRPFQEFSVLVAMLNLGLPVPKPVAALCQHRGIFSRGALITHSIENVQTLADYLPQSLADKKPPAKEQVDAVDFKIWQNAGRCIRSFHAAGLWHADLNARNILVDTDRMVHLIDFDRARFTPGKFVDGHNNLVRLKRSMLKICAGKHDKTVSMAWSQLMEGYDE